MPQPNAQEQLRAYVGYLRDLGIYDLYHRDDPATLLSDSVREQLLQRPAVSSPQHVRSSSPVAAVASTHVKQAPATPSRPPLQPRENKPPMRQESGFTASLRTNQPPPSDEPPIASYFDIEPGIPNLPPSIAAPMPKPLSFDQLAPLPTEVIAPAARAAALEAVRAEIGDCTRCPLAYAGRHKIVFADGDPNARLMFVGEGPGADEDTTGLPFVGKAGQLLNNMIQAMGLQREQVYIANIVKCRPPGNRTPEPVEANTCSPFLVKQIDIVRPEVIVALGSTAATYLLGVKQSLASLRGRWHGVRGSKVAVTYHPAFLLRDPRQKGEAWKDLQMVMAEMKLTPPAKKQ